MSLSLFLARRIYGHGSQGRKVSGPATRIATAGVAIGLAVMIVTVAVVLGFKHTIRDKVAGFGSHIQVLGISGPPIDISDSVKNVLMGVEGVSRVQPFALAQGILKTDNDFLGVAFKGIGPDYDTSFLSSCVVQGHMPKFTDKNPLQPGVANSQENPYALVISKNMADKLSLKVGDIVYAYFIGEKLDKIAYRVDAIYQTNMKRFDDVFCIIDIYGARRRNGWKGTLSTGAELLVKDFDKTEQTDERITDLFATRGRTDSEGHYMASQTIKDAYPQVFQWIGLLDINVWIILALMAALAGFTMISGLLIIILERTQMIGVLKALGARNRAIRHTFLWLATFIIGRGLAWGNALGIGIILIQQLTGIVKLDPQTYYVSEAPVELNLPLVLLLNIATLIICVAILVLPSFIVARIHPARSMRYE